MPGIQNKSNAVNTKISCIFENLSLTFFIWLSIKYLHNAKTWALILKYYHFVAIKNLALRPVIMCIKFITSKLSKWLLELISLSQAFCKYNELNRACKSHKIQFELIHLKIHICRVAWPWYPKIAGFPNFRSNH